VNNELISLFYLTDIAVGEESDSGFAALALQHSDDLTRTAVAELLSQLLFVVGDAMFFYEPNEVPWSVAGQCRFAEVRVPGEVVLCGGVDIGKITTPPSGNFDLLSKPFVVFQKQDPPSTIRRCEGAKHAATTTTNNNDIILFRNLRAHQIVMTEGGCVWNKGKYE
jgi:hypothetical protein